MAKLGEICDIKSGGTPSRSKMEYWNGSIPWVKIGDFNSKHIVSTSEFISDEGLKNSSAKMVKKGSILYTIFATLGEVAILDIDATTNQAIASLTLVTSKVDVDYLYYFLVSLKEYVNRIGRGVAQNNINMSILRNIEIPLPSLERQKQISSTLDKLQSIITHRKRQLEKLDELVKARFVEMFGTMPQNEKGWETGKIRDIVSEVRYGSSRKAAEGDSGRYPYLRMNNITYGGELDLTDTKTIDVPEDELPKCSVRRGDVLFNRTNSRELVGKTCVYNRDELMVLAGFVVRVRVNEKVTPEFLSAFLNTDFSKRMLFSMCKEAIGQANINAQELQSIAIYIPPVELQKQFSEFLERINKSKVAVQKALDEAQLLFDSLMQEYFG